VVERGYGGYVAKDEASVYEGGLTRRWLKVNQKGLTVEEERMTLRLLPDRRAGQALCGDGSGGS